MKKIYALFAVIAMLTVAVGFTSCSDDDNKSTTIFYKMGFSKYNYKGTSEADMLEEMSTITSAFKTALGVNDSYFQMTGSSKSCDKEVVAKCKAAETSLSGQTFKSSFKFTITNQSTDKVIYTFEN